LKELSKVPNRVQEIGPFEKKNSAQAKAPVHRILDWEDMRDELEKSRPNKNGRSRQTECQNSKKKRGKRGGKFQKGKGTIYSKVEDFGVRDKK